MNILEFIQSKQKSEKIKDTKKPSGLIIFENENIASIATLKSNNKKTGDMVQIYILVKDIDPVTAIKTGNDESICGNCPQRRFNGGGCYVNVGKDVLSVWNSYKKGNYKNIKDVKNWLRYFKGRFVRFGAYGDPAFLPLELINKITENCEGWTGYTHQWEDKSEYNNFFMASVDTENKKELAEIKGYRYFQVVAEDYKLKTTETVCPNLINQNINCIDCGLCDGYNKKKNIITIAHGPLKTKFNFN